VDAGVSAAPERVLAALLRGGVRLVQYRAKAGVDRELVRYMHRLTQDAGALLIVNDDVAAAEDADGLHVGQEDLAMLGRDRRPRLGQRLFGVSCALPSEVDSARRIGADYIGAGPFAATSSKDDAGPAIGAAGVRAVVEAAAGLPVAAIGGIGLDDLASVASTGARMAAVLSALVRGGEPEAAARAMVDRWISIASHRDAP
jgi:thiamine-phosphate pyrophosphorylase